MASEAKLDLTVLVTETDEPMDSLRTEKQQRLLVEPLQTSWRGDRRRFLVTANVGVFTAVRMPRWCPTYS